MADDEISKLKEKLEELRKAYTCTVTPEMKWKRDAQVEIFTKLSLQDENTYTVTDLNRGRFDFHASANDKRMDIPAISTDNEENNDYLLEITHPNDRIRVLQTELKAYADLQALPVDKRDNFSFRYMRRILDKHGKYQLYIHCVSVMICDAAGIPWLMFTTTKRLPECCSNDECMADIYHLIPTLDLSKGVEIYDGRLSEHELKILDMVYDGLDNTIIAKLLFLSEHTVLTHYKIIRKKLKADTIFIAALYAKILGLINMFLVLIGLTGETI
jgi:DNA-binding CsgD family transcriptional regulator